MTCAASLHRISPSLDAAGSVLVLDASTDGPSSCVSARGQTSFANYAEWLGEISTNLRRRTLVGRS